MESLLPKLSKKPCKYPAHYIMVGLNNARGWERRKRIWGTDAYGWDSQLATKSNTSHSIIPTRCKFDHGQTHRDHPKLDAQHSGARIYCQTFQHWRQKLKREVKLNCSNVSLPVRISSQVKARHIPTHDENRVSKDQFKVLLQA